MSAPLSDADVQRGLAALRFREGSDWLFPAGMRWAEEEARIFRATELLAAEFGRCRASPRAIGEGIWPSREDDTFLFSSLSGVLLAGPRRGKDVSLVVLVCTFGIATMWPLPSQRWSLRRVANRLFGGVADTWVPGWWDQASTDVERAIVRAAGCLAEGGYEYVPDPVFDEPYDGRFGRVIPRAHDDVMYTSLMTGEFRWVSRYFELHPRNSLEGTASHPQAPLDNQ